MKKLFLLLLLPLVLATQCEDDINTGFETTYLIENTSSTDLLYLTPQNSFVEIPVGTEISVASDLNSETNPIPPSDSFIFSEIKLYSNDNESFILVYSQEPIDNASWEFTEPTVNNFEYRLIITDDVLN
ncbi:hypothetical protein [uncultured Winogradskyella sp.]|uniref:hypothetical protein n=1 Tax=uncultured Winogradskyella sp. TaxID=395353 RepID=UPI003518776B